jgi:hypothetical protein
VSAEDLEFLQEGGRRYILGTAKCMLKRFEQELTAKDWKEVHEGLEVRLCPAPEGKEVFIPCRSAERRQKEQAMHKRFEERIEEGLNKIAASCAKKKQLAVKIAERVGRIPRTPERIRGQNHGKTTRPRSCRLRKCRNSSPPAEPGALGFEPLKAAMRGR